MEKTQKNVFLRQPQEKKQQEIIKYFTQNYDDDDDFKMGEIRHSRTEAEIKEIVHYVKEAFVANDPAKSRCRLITDQMDKEFPGSWSVIIGSKI